MSSLKFCSHNFFRCVCPSLSDRKKRLSKSYRTCRSNNNTQSNCCTTTNNSNSPLIRNAPGDEQRHSGRRGSDELCSGSESNVNSRARPLYIPSSEWARHHNEPNHYPQGQLEPAVTIQQPKRQPERPTELFLSTKQLENGHAYPKPQASTYMEQFWICTKR